MLQPFEIAVPTAVLDDLSARLRATRLPQDTGGDWEAGTSPAYLRELLDYWRDRYDWRTQEAALNRFHHVRLTCDGTSLHLIHQRGRGPSPFPLLLTHGFPDSFYRFVKLIPLLADPAAHGGDPADAFDLVVPSLPGFAFSEAREANGGLFGFGDLWHHLMTEGLGYRRFGAHGGDWGSTITEQLARRHPSSVAGIHLTDVPFLHSFHPPADLSAAERQYLGRMNSWQQAQGAYALIQGTWPRSLAVGLNDSPAGLAAWLVEMFHAWSDIQGDLEQSYTKDELLTNVMLYWVTGTVRTSFQPYRDVTHARSDRGSEETRASGPDLVEPPAGFALFPKDISHPPREWAERFFRVRRWSLMPRGGHFAALEDPDGLAREIREFFRPLRGPA
jgi:pimeloyl-ACP methyl ester carboxylesterase